MNKTISVILFLTSLLLSACVDKAALRQQALSLTDFSDTEKKEALEKYFSKEFSKIFWIDPFQDDKYYYSWNYSTMAAAKEKGEKQRHLVPFIKNNTIVYEEELAKYLNSPLGRGREYFKNSEYKKAISEFKLDLRQNKNDWYVHNRLGWAYMYSADFKNAEIYFGKAISFSDKSRFWNTEGLVDSLISQYKYDEAYETLNSFKKRYPAIYDKHKNETAVLRWCLLAAGNYFIEDKEELLNMRIVGARVRKADRGLRISYITNNTPGYYAGIKPGDVITKIEDHSLSNQNPIAIKKYLDKNSELNDNVRITVLREGELYTGELHVGLTQKLLDGKIRKSKLRSINSTKPVVAKQQTPPPTITAKVPPKANTPALKKIALVIGNSNYQHAPLKNAHNDARLIASSLKSLNFNVTESIDSNLRKLNNDVDAFYSKLQSADVGLVYYAGHGLQVNGRNYLIPIGARISSASDVRYEAMPAGKIVDKMGESNSLTNIVILDACRNNPFRSFYRNGDQGLARMTAPTGTVLIYSTAPGSVAADGAGHNGIFTKNFVKYLKRDDLDLNGILIHTRREVMLETKGQQVPWESSSLTDYFYFAR